MKKFSSGMGLRSVLTTSDEIMIKAPGAVEPEYTTLEKVFAKMGAAPDPILTPVGVLDDADILKFVTSYGEPHITTLSQVRYYMENTPRELRGVLRLDDAILVKRIGEGTYYETTPADLKILMGIVAAPKEYTVKLYQGGTTKPQPQGQFIDTLQITPADNSNPLYRGVLFDRTAVGKYCVDVMWREGGSPVSGGKLALSFNDGTCKVTGMVVGGSSPWAWVRYTFETYNHAGVLADDMIYFTNATFKLYS